MKMWRGYALLHCEKEVLRHKRGFPDDRRGVPEVRGMHLKKRLVKEPG
jgi:hypothetical protein